MRWFESSAASLCALVVAGCGGDASTSYLQGNPPLQLSVSDGWATALTEDGQGFYWLGDEHAKRIPNIDARLTRLEVGTSHFCALTDDHRVWCWGRNVYGQVGREETQDELEPALVESLVGQVDQVVVNENSSCALLLDGRVVCWGEAVAGSSSRPEPEEIEGFSGRPVQLQIGNGMGCALLENGGVDCWRRIDSGFRMTSAPLQGPATRLLPFARSFACAVLSGGGVSCFTLWNYGLDLKLSEPPGALDSSDGASGDNFTCLVRDPGQASCFLWEDVIAPHDLPVFLSEVNYPELSSVRQIVASNAQVCAQDKAGVWCWGFDHNPTKPKSSPRRVQF